MRGARPKNPICDLLRCGNAKFRTREKKSAKAVREFSRLVEISGTFKSVPYDPGDDRVVACVVAGNATHIVTEDKHFLSLTNRQSVASVKASGRCWFHG